MVGQDGLQQQIISYQQQAQENMVEKESCNKGFMQPLTRMLLRHHKIKHGGEQYPKHHIKLL
jgi:hypothetical protein